MLKQVIKKVTFVAQTKHGLKKCKARYKALPYAKRKDVWLVSPGIMARYSKEEKKAFENAFDKAHPDEQEKAEVSQCEKQK